jgi:TonB family protein
MLLMWIALLQAIIEPAVPPRRIQSATLYSDDYPDAAVLLGQEGDVRAQLTIGVDGRARDCAIVSSSGFPALEKATWKIFGTRTRFTPALDMRGQPTVGKWTGEVRWRIEGNELPVAPWMIRLMVALDKRGTPTNCVIQAGGALKRDESLIDCAELSGAFSVPADLAQRYAGHDTVLIFDQQFVPQVVNSINAPPDLTRFPLLSRKVIRLSIDPGGHVGTCSETISEGDYKPSVDGCVEMRNRRFKPDVSGRTSPVAGTATTAIYTYVK